MKTIGKYLTVDDITRSIQAKRAGIDNSITDEELLKNAEALVVSIYDPLCDHLGIRIPFDSFFRCFLLNKLVKGSSTSQHVKCEAIDLDAGSGLKLSDGYPISNLDIFNAIIELNLPFDQLIYEFGDDKNPDWVHCSHSRTKNRGVVLRSIKTVDPKSGKQTTSYINYTRKK